ncbi:hypothetical protein S40293_11166 [Stachybotrys chartarum IBT 40293]|nr:hypothetical protein S40293_11166 [Stachybotrys chartarum IBT 40293]
MSNTPLPLSDAHALFANLSWAATNGQPSYYPWSLDPEPDTQADIQTPGHIRDTSNTVSGCRTDSHPPLPTPQAEGTALLPVQGQRPGHGWTPHIQPQIVQHMHAIGGFGFQVTCASADRPPGRFSKHVVRMDDTTSSQVHDAQSACNNLFRTSRRVGLHQVKYTDNLRPRGVGGQDGKTRPSKIRYLDPHLGRAAGGPVESLA